MEGSEDQRAQASTTLDPCQQNAASPVHAVGKPFWRPISVHSLTLVRCAWGAFEDDPLRWGSPL